MAVLSTYDEIYNYPKNTDCTVILKVENFFVNNQYMKSFINCRTKDGKCIPCVAHFLIDNCENIMNVNDVIELQNVEPYNHFNKRFNVMGLNLKIHGSSKVNVVNPQTNSKKQIIPRNVTVPPAISTSRSSHHSRSRSVINAFARQPVEKTKITGTIQNDLAIEHLNDDDADYKHGVYVTTLLLFDGRQIRLIISKKFGNWPGELLQKGHVVSVVGENTTYYNMEARFVKPGSYLDIASEDEIASARKHKSCLRSSSVGRKKVLLSD